jgi:hypothetical protein
MFIQCHAVWGRAPFVLIVLAPIMLAEAVIMAISTFTQIGREWSYLNLQLSSLGLLNNKT